MSLLLVLYLASAALSVPACLYLAWNDYQDGADVTVRQVVTMTIVLSALPVVQWLAPMAAVLVWQDSREWPL